MIQRIQSIYLFLAGLSGLILFIAPFAIIAELPLDRSIYLHNNLYGLILLIFSCAVSLAGIFFFPNRKRQMAICSIAILLFLAVLGMIIYQLATIEFTAVGMGIVVPFISIGLLMLARNAIHKDEKLVRSADRLR